MKELNERALKWAEDKGILDKATARTQFEKMAEEVQELADEIGLKNPAMKERARMELGDVLVTAIILSRLMDSTPEECLEMALEKIEKRTGEMLDGKFVKNARIES